MNTEKNRKIEEILGSLDNIQRAVAPDFFYTRLKARMEKGLSSDTRPHWVLRPVYAVAVLLVVLAINAAVILKGNTTSETNGTNDTDISQSIASEYSINPSLTYDINP